jgi:hypothetical protein
MRRTLHSSHNLAAVDCFCRLSHGFVFSMDLMRNHCRRLNGISNSLQSGFGVLCTPDVLKRLKKR